MKWFMSAVMVTFFVLFTVSIGSGGEETFDTENILSELESQLELSKEKLDSLKPTIDAKSKELKKAIQESVDKGFVQFEEMGRALDEVSKDTEKKVKSFLDSEEMQKLKDYLGKIDKDAIKRTQEKLVAELSEVLDLTASQIEELKPVLKDSMAQMNEMIEEMAASGSKNWNSFKKQYEEMSRELKEKLQETLDAKQMKKLEKYNEEKRDKIQQALFV